jgi:hypothetical protein
MNYMFWLTKSSLLIVICVINCWILSYKKVDGKKIKIYNNTTIT